MVFKLGASAQNLAQCTGDIAPQTYTQWGITAVLMKELPTACKKLGISLLDMYAFCVKLLNLLA